MAHALGRLEGRSDEDPLATKNTNFIYTTNKPLDAKVANEKESMITKWAAWISGPQLCGYLLSILGWIMCVTSTAAEQWRIWHVENVIDNPSGVVWVGIWRVCYMYGTNSENIFLRCEDFTEDYKTLPKEIFLAQDLMSLGCIVGAVAICFMTFALWNVFKTITQKTFLLTFFSLGGILNLMAGIMILIPISWNLYSILNNAGIVFPEFFRVPTFPKEQQVGAAIYVGYVAAVLFLLSGFLILCNKYALKLNQEKNPELVNLPMIDELCTACQSSVVIDIQNKMPSETSLDDLFSNSTDINKHSSKAVKPQLSENISNHPIILVTPCK
ncbi:claudin-34 isoform 1-T3 [Liasis olivaceus]